MPRNSEKFRCAEPPSKTFADGLELDHATTFHHFRLLHTARKLKLPTVTHAKHFTSQASMSLIPAQSVPPEVSLRSWFDANVSGIHLEAANSAPKFLCGPLWGELLRPCERLKYTGAPAIIFKLRLGFHGNSFAGSPTRSKRSSEKYQLDCMLQTMDTAGPCSTQPTSVAKEPVELVLAETPVTC